MIRNNNIGKFTMATGDKREIKKKTIVGYNKLNKRYLVSLRWIQKTRNIDGIQERIKGYPPLQPVFRKTKPKYYQVSQINTNVENQSEIKAKTCNRCKAREN